MPLADLEWALAQHRDRARRARYKLARDYYEGRHRLMFAIERFDTVFAKRLEVVRDNLCPAVVDSVTDRLKVIGFSSSAVRRRNVRQEDGSTKEVVTDALAGQALAVWRRNRMDQRASDVHRESLLTGDGYVIVSLDLEGRAALWPQSADEMVVEYSETEPGVIVRAARIWRTKEGQRVNVYLPSQTERWISEQRSRSASAGAYRRLSRGGTIRNPFGRAPVFHFPNKRLFGPGVSELHDVIPLQDALNKSVCDLLVSMEFSSYRQRWATGIEVETDENGKPVAPPFEPGVDRIFAAEEATARFGDFSETNLEQFLKVQEDLRAEIARVSGTPLHYLFITRGDFPSGEAMKSAEARFSTKLVDRQDGNGNSWEDALSFALRLEGRSLPGSFELSTIWQTAAPRSDEEIARTATLKRTIGFSRREILRSDYGLSEERIEEMLAEEEAPPPAGPPASQ